MTPDERAALERGLRLIATGPDKAAAGTALAALSVLEQLALESGRLDAILTHSHEIICRVPGGIRCIDSRDDVDEVIAAYAYHPEPDHD